MMLRKSIRRVTNSARGSPKKEHNSGGGGGSNGYANGSNHVTFAAHPSQMGGLTPASAATRSRVKLATPSRLTTSSAAASSEARVLAAFSRRPSLSVLGVRSLADVAVTCDS